jgi:integrase/recombinase XerD
MNIQQSTSMSPLRARMIADMIRRNLGRAFQTSHQRACKRFAAWLGRSAATATQDDVTYSQQHLIEIGTSICTRRQTMTSVKFLFRVVQRRHDLVAEIFHRKKPVKGRCCGTDGRGVPFPFRFWFGPHALSRLCRGPRSGS